MDHQGEYDLVYDSDNMVKLERNQLEDPINYLICLKNGDITGV